MAGEFSRTVGGGCLRGLLLQLGVMALCLALLLCCGGLGAAIPVEADQRPLVMLLSLLGWVSLCFFGAMAFAVFNIRRVGRRVDAAFAPLGVQGEPQMTIGRQYHGMLGTRRFDAYFQKGPAIELYLEVEAGARLVVAPGSALVRAAHQLTGKYRTEPMWPELKGTSASANDGPWCDALLADPAARAAIADLLQTGGAAELRVVSVHPDAVHVLIRGASLAIIEGEKVPQAAEALRRLADRVEAAAPPAQREAPSALATRMRKQRPGPATALIIVIATVAVVVVLSAVVGVLVVVLLP